MNNVTLIGRLTKDPEKRSTTSNISVCSFTVAVDRRFKSEGQPEVDFINCVAWRNTADFICKYFTKGQKIGLTGSIQVRSWKDKDGNNRYATEVVVDGVDFCDSKKSDNAQDNNGFIAPPEQAYYQLDDESDIPF